jgi:hypothetical protein
VFLRTKVEVIADGVAARRDEIRAILADDVVTAEERERLYVLAWQEDGAYIKLQKVISCINRIMQYFRMDADEVPNRHEQMRERQIEDMERRWQAEAPIECDETALAA